MKKPTLDNSIYVIAHNIRSMHNVGSIFRTADAFGVQKIYLTGYTGTPPDSRIKKVALGAEEFINWEYAKSVVRIIKKLKEQGIKIVALENNIKYPTISLAEFKPQLPLALLLGEETKGHSKKLLELADNIIEIPMSGRKESLNVSVAGGIALFEISKLNLDI